MSEDGTDRFGTTKREATLKCTADQPCASASFMAESATVQMLWGERRGVCDHRRGSEPTLEPNAKVQADRPKAAPAATA